MWLGLIVGGLYIINAFIAIVTVFRSHRDISAVWAWLLVLLLLPFVGFLIYFVFGRKLRADRMQDLMTQRLLGINDLVVQQQEALAAGQPLIGTPGSGCERYCGRTMRWSQLTMKFRCFLCGKPFLNSYLKILAWLPNIFILKPIRFSLMQWAGNCVIY